MSKRVQVWCGAAVAFAVLVGLGVYFLSVGLDRADKVASVIGAFVGLAGLGLALHGMLSAPAQAVGGVHNEISGTVHGDSIQARDIHGGITFGGPDPS
ncbi:hypothetical protein GCM10022252_18770 [Streptosporangium oxazolinicum]|uniref:Uncharacterized protein n=1 Tax=Streptosporangium oxazolinicum TaxID=909287 RepID=A0ABP8AMS8_9ACTN